MLEAGAHRAFELLDLRRALLGNLFHRAIKNPTGVAGVCLDSANSCTHKLSALAIRERNVIEKAGRNLRHAVVETSVETLAGNRLNVEVVLSAQRLNSFVHDLLRLLIDRCCWCGL